MRAILFVASAFSLAACATDDRDPGPAGPELAGELAGRVAGPPQMCVSQRDLRANRTVDGGDAIIFSAVGDTLYVNRPPGGCPSLRFGRTLVTRTTTGQLCRGEIVEVVDLSSGMVHGSCGLGDFVPYRTAGK